MANEFEGGLQKIAGRVQDTLGAAAGDSELQVKGKVRQAAGSVQETYGNAMESIREQAVANPLATVAAAVGVGFLLGIFWSNRD